MVPPSSGEEEEERGEGERGEAEGGRKEGGVDGVDRVDGLGGVPRGGVGCGLLFMIKNNSI